MHRCEWQGVYHSETGTRAGRAATPSSGEGRLFTAVLEQVATGRLRSLGPARMIDSTGVRGHVLAAAWPKVSGF